MPALIYEAQRQAEEHAQSDSGPDGGCAELGEFHAYEQLHGYESLDFD